MSGLGLTRLRNGRLAVVGGIDPGAVAAAVTRSRAPYVLEVVSGFAADHVGQIPGGQLWVSSTSPLGQQLAANAAAAALASVGTPVTATPPPATPASQQTLTALPPASGPLLCVGRWYCPVTNLFAAIGTWLRGHL